MMLSLADVTVTWFMFENNPKNLGKFAVLDLTCDDWSDCTVSVQATAPDGRWATFTLRAVCEDSAESFLASGDYNIACNACLSKLNGRKELPHEHRSVSLDSQRPHHRGE
jgi:hypothetical protein